MPPVRRDIGQRHENEGPVLKSRMGQDELIRCLSPLAFWRRIPPILIGRQIGRNAVTMSQDVEVQRPACPAALTAAAKPPPRSR